MLGTAWRSPRRYRRCGEVDALLALHAIERLSGGTAQSMPRGGPIVRKDSKEATSRLTAPRDH
jgi:hypothetical protein